MENAAKGKGSFRPVQLPFIVVSLVGFIPLTAAFDMRSLSRPAILGLLALWSVSTFAPDVARGAAFECRPARVMETPVVLDQIAVRVAKREDIRILAIGSSSTEGVGGSSKRMSYPSRLEALLASRWSDVRVSVTNAGIGGEAAPETVARLKAMVRAERFDLVIWQVGTNDAVRGGDISNFESLLAEGFDAARDAGIPLAVMDPQFFPGIKHPAHYHRYVESIRTMAREKGIAVLTRFDLMKGWFIQDREGFLDTLATDRFHMSDVGYDCLARNVANSIIAMVDAYRPMTARVATSH